MSEDFGYGTLAQKGLKITHECEWLYFNKLICEYE